MCRRAAAWSPTASPRPSIKRPSTRPAPSLPLPKKRCALRAPPSAANNGRLQERPMIKIRDYQDSDCEALADIFTSAVRQIARRDYSPAQIAAWAPDMRDMDKFAALRSTKPTFVAEYKGQ